MPGIQIYITDEDYKVYLENKKTIRDILKAKAAEAIFNLKNGKEE